MPNIERRKFLGYLAGAAAIDLEVLKSLIGNLRYENLLKGHRDFILDKV